MEMDRCFVKLGVLANIIHYAQALAYRSKVTVLRCTLVRPTVYRRQCIPTLADPGGPRGPCPP